MLNYEEFPHEFLVNEQQSKIEGHRPQEKIRMIIAKFQRPHISSGGETAVFFLKGLRVSDDRKHFLEDVSKKPHYGNEIFVGIARKTIPKLYRAALRNETSKEQLLADYFMQEKPKRLFLKENYGR